MVYEHEEKQNLKEISRYLAYNWKNIHALPPPAIIYEESMKIQPSKALRKKLQKTALKESI